MDEYMIKQMKKRMNGQMSEQLNKRMDGRTNLQRNGCNLFLSLFIHPCTRAISLDMERVVEELFILAKEQHDRLKYSPLLQSLTRRLLCLV